MITAILKKETCQICRNCCKYDDNDIWDAPGFTKQELERAQKLVADPVYKTRGLYFFKMEKNNEEYICPLLSDTGCRLGLEKPFKCAIWPLYVVHINDRLALTVSNECPTIYKLSNEEIVNRLGGVIAQITDVVKAKPELVEPLRTHFRFITYID